MLKKTGKPENTQQPNASVNTRAHGGMRGTS